MLGSFHRCGQKPSEALRWVNMAFVVRYLRRPFVTKTGPARDNFRLRSGARLDGTGTVPGISRIGDWNDHSGTRLLEESRFRWFSGKLICPGFPIRRRDVFRTGIPPPTSGDGKKGVATDAGDQAVRHRACTIELTEWKSEGEERGTKPRAREGTSSLVA